MRLYKTSLFRHICITGSRIVDQLSILFKPGSVAGAVPCVLLRIPFQRTAHMGTALHSRSEKPCQSFQCIYKQLRFPYTSRWIKNCLPPSFPAADHLCQNMRCCHGGSHSPFSKTGCHIQPRCVPGVFSNIRDAVQTHTVLGRPVIVRLTNTIILLHKLLKLFPASPFSSSSVASPTYQKIIFVIAEGHALLRLIHIHSPYI